MADANTYDNPWMKSKIGTNDENNCRCKVPLFSAPSATKALRGAAQKPSAHAAAEKYADAVADFEEAKRRDTRLQVLDDDMLDDSYFSALLGAARAEAEVSAGCALLDRYGEHFPEGRHVQDARDWQKRLRGELKSHFVKERYE